MSVLELLPKLRERKPEAIIALAVILTTPLFLIIWRGWLYEITAQGVAAVPPKILGALIGLLAIWLLASLAFTVVFALRVKQSKNEFFRFNVYWDKSHTPHCPSCRTALGNWSQRQNSFICPKCEIPIPLKDETGQSISLVNARAKLNASKLLS